MLRLKWDSLAGSIPCAVTHCRMTLLGECTWKLVLSPSWILPDASFSFADFNPYPFAIITITTNVTAFLISASPSSQSLKLRVILGGSERERETDRQTHRHTHSHTKQANWNSRNKASLQYKGEKRVLVIYIVVIYLNKSPMLQDRLYVTTAEIQSMFH